MIRNDAASRSVVHLGDIELSSDSGDDFATKPAKKRLKRNERKSVSSDVIDLCSDPEESLTPSKTPIRTRMEENVVIVLSSDDEDHPSQDLFNSGMDVDNSRMETFPKSQGANDRELPNSQEDEVPIPAMSNRIPSSQNEEIPFQSLQPLLPKARKTDKPKFGSGKVPCFTTSTSARPSRIILFTGDLPNPILHTPGFFSRAITFAKNSVLAAQKRAKKRRLQALLLSSSSLNQESTCTPVQCTRPCEPEVSTLDVPPSSSVAEETVSRRANLRTTPATSPDYPVPVQTKIQENNTFTHPEEITGSYFDEAHESGVAHVPEKPASGVDSPSMDGDGHDLQRNFVGPETPESTAATSGRPVLRAPTAHDALSIDETNHEDNLDASMLSSRESNSAEPDYVPITSHFKSSRSISEIPEKTRSSAQCLVRVLNDFKMSKKLG
ncbi:hypothetical protein M413DRAFT_401281 [Hebeloma cylindrosporum]|uniref:Uncharacterized protein n=1 Tax=Hebeloma cylindrosporum TaxID=76867 RepID=A0A0C3CGM0_HEBCY|nr:hypothetical protein M413DRAFT_401281 [Hebeloma cylindrosporum h7]